ncbi:MAG: hypothetical protein SFY67_02980 [Candidatus Melainabacteria bacterium]|nr:hypothetical protein [Candidatus Melainabacteria bacterium]
MDDQSNASLKLGSLLLTCEFASASQIDHGAQFAKIAGIPLGKALCFLEIIKPQILEDVLEAQGFTLASKLSHDEAIFVLKTAEKFQLRFAQAIEICYLNPHDKFATRVGNLLKMQGFSNSKINMALRIARKSGKPIGQVAIQLGIISNERLDHTLKIQRTIRSLNEQLLEPWSGHRNSICRIGELLTKSGCIDQKSLEQALDEKDFASQKVGTYLLAQNLINDSLLHMALSLQNLVRGNHIKMKSAISSLRTFSQEQSQMTIGQFLTICQYYDFNDEEKLISMLDQNSSLYKEILKALTTSEMAEYCDSGMLLKLAARNQDVMRLLLHLLRPEEQSLIDSAIVFYSLAKDNKMTMSQALTNCLIRKSQAPKQDLSAA